MSVLFEAFAMAKKRKRWSQKVNEHSDALNLSKGVFTWKSSKRIAGSLKRSAEHSSRRKSGAYQSVISMLTFYINRAGKDLPAERRKVLNQAKIELRRVFGREPE